MTSTTEQYALLTGAVTAYIAVIVVTYVISSFLLMKMFQKAGVDGWKAWVPFVNSYYTLVMGGRNGWLFALSFIPFVGALIYLVFLILAMIEINKRFGQGGGMLAVFIFFPVIYYGIIGFGSAQWRGPEVNSGVATAPIPAGAGYGVQPQYAQPVPHSPQGYVPAASPGYAATAAAPTSGDVLLGVQPGGIQVFYDLSNTVVNGVAGSGKTRLVREIVRAHLAGGGFLALITDRPQEYTEFTAQGFAQDGPSAVALLDSIGSSIQGRMTSIQQGANVAPILIVCDSAQNFAEVQGIIERLDRMATVSDQARIKIVIVSQAPVSQVGVLPTPSFPTRIEKSAMGAGRITDFTSERNFSAPA